MMNNVNITDVSVSLDGLRRYYVRHVSGENPADQYNTWDDLCDRFQAECERHLRAPGADKTVFLEKIEIRKSNLAFMQLFNSKLDGIVAHLKQSNLLMLIAVAAVGIGTYLVVKENNNSDLA